MNFKDCRAQDLGFMPQYLSPTPAAQHQADSEDRQDYLPNYQHHFLQQTLVFLGSRPSTSPAHFVSYDGIIAEGMGQK